MTVSMALLVVEPPSPMASSTQLTTELQSVLRAKGTALTGLLVVTVLLPQTMVASMVALAQSIAEKSPVWGVEDSPITRFSKPLMLVFTLAWVSEYTVVPPTLMSMVTFTVSLLAKWFSLLRTTA